jgi:hypothetical protein
MQMLKWTSDELRIAFFNICDSESHARAAAEIFEASIGMRGQIKDMAARTFAAALYSGLAYGHSLQNSFQQACAAIRHLPDSAVPQLFFRDGIDPHKVVLVRPGSLTFASRPSLAVPAITAATPRDRRRAWIRRPMDVTARCL